MSHLSQQDAKYYLQTSLVYFLNLISKQEFEVIDPKKEDCAFIIRDGGHGSHVSFQNGTNFQSNLASVISYHSVKFQSDCRKHL